MLVPHRKHTYWPLRPVKGIALLCYMWMTFVAHRNRTYASSRPVTAIALLCYMWMTFVPHRKHTYWPPRPVTAIALLYVDDVRTSQETHLLASTAYYSDSSTLLYVDDVRTSQETHLLASRAYYGDSFTPFLTKIKLLILGYCAEGTAKTIPHTRWQQQMSLVWIR
jgi:hypothetical protein